jgi:hypothetical protein
MYTLTIREIYNTFRGFVFLLKEFKKMFIGTEKAKTS